MFTGAAVKAKLEQRSLESEEKGCARIRGRNSWPKSIDWFRRGFLTEGVGSRGCDQEGPDEGSKDYRSFRLTLTEKVLSLTEKYSFVSVESDNHYTDLDAMTAVL